MITTDTAVGLVGFYINGVWEKAQGHTTFPVTNPATGMVLANVPFATADDVDRTVRTAHEAFLKWRDVPVVDRVQVLYRFKVLLEEHAVEVAATLTRENGKTSDDSKMEVRRAIQMVEVACGMPSLMMGDSLNDVAREIDCKTIRQPIG
ncbi:MAG: aldehyde dehydrogenase family protein, partial [Acidobacteriota bacterium]|nr:aldehyde dehydrogenase family protein [Acidobacteriota bacterium]